jgi:hypothetical protein
MGVIVIHSTTASSIRKGRAGAAQAALTPQARRAIAVVPAADSEEACGAATFFCKRPHRCVADARRAALIAGRRWLRH